MSKVIPFKIPKSQKEFIRFQRDEGGHFYEKLHQHPEWQLTLILEGRGQLMVGDYLGRFEPGDIYLMGSNVPHVFRSDQEYFEKPIQKISRSNTLFFDFEALGQGIWEVDEFSELKQFLVSIKGCYRIIGKTAAYIKTQILDFHLKNGLPKILGALEVLQELQVSTGIVSLNRLDGNLTYSESEGKRMDEVMQFLLSQSHRQIQLQEVSDKANMSKEAFCRFFKERTGKTFTEFLSQIRIHQACQLLQESEFSVLEIAYQSGYQNLSYFNRTFKKIKGKTPKAFRKSFDDFI